MLKDIQGRGQSVYGHYRLLPPNGAYLRVFSRIKRLFISCRADLSGEDGSFAKAGWLGGPTAFSFLPLTFLPILAG
jgi:hypothetical protein